jgi:hypothetical protein
MTDHHMTIAKIILDQLGGTRFTVMTGAKNLTAGRDGLGSLTMKLPPCGFKKKIDGKAITHVRITLTPADVYKVEIINVGKSATTLETADDVYCDMLQDTFFSMTGLMTRLGQ